MGSRRGRLRLALFVLVLFSTVVVLAGYVQAERSNDRVFGDPAVEQAFQTGDRSPVVDPRENATVVATDSNAVLADESTTPRGQAELVAFAPDGSIHYHQDDHTRYWDVDPVEGTEATVEFVYADHLTAEECNASTVCTRNGIERVNLTTGERTQVYDRITPDQHSTRWHDVDRIDDERLLVADIDRDRVFVVNTTTELIEWEWDARADYDVSSGGPFPDDWTHLNDVEYVEIDGREAAMVSLRNQDQVVFVDLERGLIEEWTLGADGDHDVLYEQHNPDYIPPERGGPALLVADSESGRVVEYQRQDGEWEQSWSWADERVQWPRDADRLPNGHTLVTDSNGDRVLEVDRDGDVVWSASIGFPYEAERLGTGEESAGGRSAAALDLADRAPSPEDRSLLDHVAAALPPTVLNGMAYLFPRWVGVFEGIAIVVGLLAGLAWLAFECRWSSVSVRLRSPVRFDRE